MPWHEVQQGDCLSRIAAGAGVPWQRVWQHPQNRELRDLRQSPHVLYPGDMVFVPEPEPRRASAPTERRTRFVARGTTVEFRLRLTLNGRPRRGLAYRLEPGPYPPLEGVTDADGWIIASLPATALFGLLRLGDGSERYEIALGHLDPADTLEGVQGRLAMLGYYGGAIDGAWSDDLARSIRRFQRAQGLVASGRVSAATRSALVDAFGG